MLYAQEGCTVHVQYVSSGGSGLKIYVKFMYFLGGSRSNTVFYGLENIHIFGDLHVSKWNFCYYERDINK